MRFDPEGITKNPEIPFAKSMPDYISRWLASRFIEDPEVHEELGILTEEVRARREAQQTLFAEEGPAGGDANGSAGNGSEAKAANGAVEAPAAEAKPPTQAATDTPPVRPAKMSGLDLGPACEQCGGMMQ